MSARHNGRKRTWGMPLVACYAALLVGASTYVLLDTFVIERGYGHVVEQADAQDAIARANARNGASGDEDATATTGSNEDATATDSNTDAGQSENGTSTNAGAQGESTSAQGTERESQQGAAAHDALPHTGSGGHRPHGHVPGSGKGEGSPHARAESSADADAGSATSSADANGSDSAVAMSDVGSTQGTSQSLVTQSQTQSASGVTTGLSQARYLDTTVYVVDITADDATQLLAAMANDTYGKNVTAKTSAIAAAHGATVAINGDYYGARNAGYVIRNGVLYRDTAASSTQQDLVIYANGDFEIVREGDVSAQELVDNGAWQVFSFGPGLVVDGAVSVSAGDEVGQAMASNPRTAIGKVSDGHYVLVVSDGRTSESAGLTLQELATYMVDELGVECAYNLDGGGSSTLYYDGQVVNNPTTSGNSIKERSVSDIVYLAA